VDQISGVTPSDAPTQAQDDSHPPADMVAAPEQSGFGSRGRARRRARFLRKARELAYRDLGGLVFNLHRFGARNDTLVLAKLTTVGQIDAELRAIEGALGERETVTVLREAGINACPRCAAIHSSEDRFCPHCGLSMGRHVDLPIAGAATTPTAAVSAPPSTPAPAEPAPVATPSPAPPVTPTAAPAPARPPASEATPGRAPTPPQSAETVQPAEPPTPLPADISGAEQPTEIIRPEPEP
jgi:hypothetical protein